MLAAISDQIEKISGPWLYPVAFALTFAETGTLLFLVPGEITLIIAGAAAGAGHINLAVLIVIACSAAILGDATGFWLGHRFGPRIHRSWLGRKIGQPNWDRADRLVVRRRGLIVLIGRWVGFLRAIMPATVGMSPMTYKQFLPWDLAGAISWATLCVVGGYYVGDRYDELESAIGKGGLILGGVVAVIAFLAWELNKRRRKAAAQEAAAAAD